MPVHFDAEFQADAKFLVLQIYSRDRLEFQLRVIVWLIVVVPGILLTVIVANMNGCLVPPQETSTSDHWNLSEATVNGDIVVGIPTFCNFIPQVGNLVLDPIKLLFRVDIAAIDENHFIAVHAGIFLGKILDKASTLQIR